VAPAAPASSASAPDPEEQPPAERAPSELGAPEGTDGAKPVPPPPVDRPEAPAAMRAEPPPEPAGTAAQDPADRESGTEPDAAPLVGGAPDLAVTAAPPPVAAAPPPVTADPPPPAAPAPRPAAELRHDPRLLSLARAELAETTRHGFATVLLASPEEQIDIARSFGEALVLVPRETPLSSIHLRGLATLNDAGAVVLFAAPGFYHGADSVQDLVDFVVSRCLDQLGVENALVERWGEGTSSLRSEVPGARS